MNKLTIPNHWLNSSISVVVVGAGGTGSALITELFQMSYLLSQLSDGNQYLDVTVYDDDTVSRTNIGRQNFWENDLGQSKSKTLVERFNAFGGVNWSYKNKRFTQKDFDENTDLLITCVDKASVRAEIGKMNSQASTIWVDTGNGNSSAQVVLGHIAGGENTLPNVYDLYPQLSSIIDKDTDSCSHAQALSKQDYGINKRVALEATNLIWRLIRHGEIHNHGSFIDLKSGVTTPMKICEKEWLMFGFDSNNRTNV